MLQTLGFTEEQHTLYSYKHTGAINLYKSTKDILAVQRHCRHSSSAQTDAYFSKYGVIINTKVISMPDLASLIKLKYKKAYHLAPPFMSESQNTNNSISLIDLGKMKIFSMIYTDLAQPGVQKVGKALGTVLDLANTLVTPVWMLNEYAGHKKEVFKSNMERVRLKINEIPQEKVCEVPPEIGVPIIDKLSYSTNEQLRESFANLLARAASEETAHLIHPSFVGILERLSSDEAKIVYSLKGKDSIPFITFRLHNRNGVGYTDPMRFLTGIEKYVELDFKQNMLVYFSNLISLGILSYTPGDYKTNDDLYAPIVEIYSQMQQQLQKVVGVDLAQRINFISEEDWQNFQKGFPGFSKLTIVKGFFEITQFGQLFIKACI